MLFTICCQNKNRLEKEVESNHVNDTLIDYFLNLESSMKYGDTVDLKFLIHGSLGDKIFNFQFTNDSEHIVLECKEIATLDKVYYLDKIKMDSRTHNDTLNFNYLLKKYIELDCLSYLEKDTMTRIMNVTSSKLGSFSIYVNRNDYCFDEINYFLISIVQNYFPDNRLLPIINIDSKNH